MSEPTPPPTAAPVALENKVLDHAEGLKADTSGEESIDQRLADIEMAGEEVAAGWKPEPHPTLSPEVRYLHVSRTIHQLITDRNRSVGIFLGVASLLFAASTALLNVRPDVVPIIPLKAIQFWCLPVTFGTLAIIGIFTSLLLVRGRIGLIHEVTKLNTLLGLPSKRVERVNPLSIYYLMHLMVALLGGASAGFTVGMLLYHKGVSESGSIVAGIGAGLVYTGSFQAAYYLTILRATTDAKLQHARS